MRGKLVPRANSSCNSALSGQGAFPIPRFPMPPSLQMLYFFKFKKSNRSTGFSFANSNGNIPANAPAGTHKLSSALQSSTSPNLQQQTTAAPKPHQWNMKPLLKQTPTHTHVLKTPLLCSPPTLQFLPLSQILTQWLIPLALWCWSKPPVGHSLPRKKPTQPPL